MIFVVMYFVGKVVSWKDIWTPIQFQEANRTNFGKCEPEFPVEDVPNFPPGRQGFAQWYNPRNHSMIIAMGTGYDCFGNGVGMGEPHLSDVFEMSLTSKKWRWIVGPRKIDEKENLADPDSFHPENYPINMEFPGFFNGWNSGFLFGGKLRNNDSDLVSTNELWEFSFSLYQWRRIRPIRLDYEEIFNHKGVFVDETLITPPTYGQSNFGFANSDEYSDVVAFFGGRYMNQSTTGLDYMVNDLFEFEISTTRFRWLGGTRSRNPIGNYSYPGVFHQDSVPAARRGPGSWKVKGNYYFHAGLSSGYFTDMWIWNTTKGLYKWLSGFPWASLSFVEDENDFHILNLPTGFFYPNVWIGTGDYLFTQGGWAARAEMWVYSISRNQWRYQSGNLNVDPSPGSYDKPYVPPGRASSIVYREGPFEIYIASGKGVDVRGESVHGINDLWMYQYHDEKCRGHGEYSRSGCICENENYDPQNNCSWTCNMIADANEQVCNGKGECLDYDVCLCLPGYTATKNLSTTCGKFRCFQFEFDDQRVCNGNETESVCENVDLCDCLQPPFYGVECKDVISHARFAEDGKLEIGYSFDTHSLPSGLQGSIFVCSLLVANDEDLGSSPLCEWVYSEEEDIEKTSYFSIKFQENDFSLKKDSQIVINVISLIGSDSEQQKQVTLVVEGNPKTEINMTAFIAIPSILGFIVCVVLMGTVISLIICLVLRRQKRRLNLFGKIENVDLILMEKGAEVEENLANIEINSKLFSSKMKDIKIIEKLGEGGQSVVYLGRWSNIDVAFKSFMSKDICNNQHTFGKFEQEVSVLASLSHPNVLKFYSAILEPPRIGIICELCKKNSDLKKYLTSNPFVELGERLRYLTEIASSLAYIHRKNIIHRDLKCENVLVSDDFHAKLMDFGLSRTVERITQTMTKKLGTTHYMAPEVIRGQSYNETADVYSFSIMMYEVISKNFTPYGKTNQMNFNIEFKIASNPDFRPIINEKDFEGCLWIIPLIKMCWSDLHTSRCSSAEICQSLKDGSKSTIEQIIKKKEVKSRTLDNDSQVNQLKLEMEKLISEYTKFEKIEIEFIGDEIDKKIWEKEFAMEENRGKINELKSKLLKHKPRERKGRRTGGKRKPSTVNPRRTEGRPSVSQLKRMSQRIGNIFKKKPPSRPPKKRRPSTKKF